jgi:hypothetical protein
MITPVVNEYLYGKGRIAVCERGASGEYGEVLYLGNCPELKISSSADKLTHFESESGRNVQDREIVKTLSAEFTITMENIARRNLALMWWSEVFQNEQAGGQEFDFEDNLVDGDIRVIENGFNISDVVIVDSVAASVTSSKYNVDTDFGVVEFLDVAGYNQPFTVQYNQGASESVPMLTTERPSRIIRFEGINLGNPGEANDKVLVELWNGAFDTPTDFSLIGDDFAKFELKGSLQVDETRKANSELGGYGRITKMGAAYVEPSSSSSSS